MTETTMIKHPELIVFPEVAGKRVWRPEVSMEIRELSDEDWELGPKVGVADGIHIGTVKRSEKARTCEDRPNGTPIHHRNGSIVPRRGHEAVKVAAQFIP